MSWMERGVSPVVGTAILIGVAVVLATIIGVFVFGLEDRPPEKPNVEFDVTQDQVDIVGRFDGGGAGQQNTYENVLQVAVEHDGGDGVKNQVVEVRLAGELDNGESASGYLLGYNVTESGAGSPFVNLTDPGWNTNADGRIGVGEGSTYEFFATSELGTDESALVPGGTRENLWRSSRCAVSAFNDTRNGGGPIKINGNSAISVGVTKDCPFGTNNATISAGEINEGGRIAPGDTVRVIWSPPDDDTQQRLATFEVADPDE